MIVGREGQIMKDYVNGVNNSMTPEFIPEIWATSGHESFTDWATNGVGKDNEEIATQWIQKNPASTNWATTN